MDAYASACNSVQVCNPRDQQCELIQFNKPPTKPLDGGRMLNQKVVDDKNMTFPFIIVGVKGRVKYKHLNGGGSKSVLKLERCKDDLQEAVDMLQLGELVGACDNVETVLFDADYCNKNKSLWVPGEKGDMFSLHS